jgi:hypothetical protein
MFRQHIAYHHQGARIVRSREVCGLTCFPAPETTHTQIHDMLPQHS